MARFPDLGDDLELPEPTRSQTRAGLLEVGPDGVLPENVMASLSGTFGALDPETHRLMVASEEVPPSAVGAAPEVALNVRDFGAMGDGAADDYQAIKDAYAAIEAAGGGALLFPPGVYYIGRHVISGGANANGVTDLTITGATGVKISGYGARVVTKGDFYRASDYTDGGFNYSHERTVNPLLFVNCTGVLVEGLELDGQANVVTRAPAIVEGGAYLLRFDGCHGVTVRDVHAHHSINDGIYLGWVGLCEDVTFMNVRSTHNARQGLTISHLRDATFLRCHFSNSGRTEGTYGAHNPSAGVDIEPEWGVAEWTENIQFLDCIFENNVGMAFVATSQTKTRNLYISGGRMSAAADFGATNFVILAVESATLRDVDIDTGAGYVLLGHQTDEGSTVLMENCTLRTKGRGITAANGTQRVTITGTEFVGYHGAGWAGNFPYLSNYPNVTFTRNKVFIPATLADAGMLTGAGWRILCLLQVGQVGENVYTTDFVPADSTNPNAHFAVSYLNSTQVAGDVFPQAGRPIRPVYNSAFPNDAPYYYGTFNTGTAQVLGGLDRRKGTGPPTAGTWKRGDIVDNAAPTPGGYAGWICTVAGTMPAAVWKGFGVIAA